MLSRLVVALAALLCMIPASCRDRGEPASSRALDAASVEPPRERPAASAPAAEPRRGRPYFTIAAPLKSPPHPVPKGVANVVAHVPEGLDASAPLNLVVFLHGSEQCAEQLALNGEVVCAKPSGARFIGGGLDARHDDAGTMSIFVIPQLAYMAGGSPGRFAERGYLATFLTEVLGDTLAPGLGGARRLEDVASITIVSQSAGWIATTALLDHRDLEDKVKNVVLVDSFFAGGVDTYARWLARAPGRRLVSVHGAWGQNVGNAQALAARARGQGARVAVDPAGSLTDAIREHDVVLARWDLEHSWMPLLLLTKTLAGLPLPPRAVTPTREPAPGHAPRPLSALPVLGTDALERRGTLGPAGLLLSNGAVADDYALELPSSRDGAAITKVTVRGGPSLTEWGNLDVVVQVLDGDRVIAFDDDSAGRFDARASISFDARGPLRLRVTTHGQGMKRGPYVIAVE